MFIIKLIFIVWLIGWGAFDAVIGFMALAIAATHDFALHPLAGADGSYRTQTSVMWWSGLRGLLGLASAIVGITWLVEIIVA